MKLTIEKVGQEKTVQTKFGPKQKRGVIFKEFPNIWHDVWASGLKEGQELEGERVSRDWEGKQYWNFQLPKKENVLGHKLEEILNGQTTIKLGINRILALLEPDRPIPKGTKVAGTQIEYPIMDKKPNFDRPYDGDGGWGGTEVDDIPFN